jgi:cytochrome c peroxidase
MRATGRPEDFGAFRAPSLRNVELTAPYMHNGVYETLEQVIEFYDEGGAKGLGISFEHQDEDVKPLELTEQDEKDLAAFLRALTQKKPLDQKPDRVPSGLVPGGSRH